VHPDSLRTIITGGQTSSVPYNNAFVISVSRDRGETWKRFPLSDPLTGFCEALACGPPGSQVIYAGGEIEGRGVMYRSDDLGISWDRTANAPSATIVSLTVSPWDYRTVYAAADRVFRSTDAGESWAECAAGSDIACVRFNPHAPGMIAAGGDSGVVLSTDNGQTWTDLRPGLENHYVPFVAFADSGRWLVCATYGRSCFTWPLATGIAERPMSSAPQDNACLYPSVTRGEVTISWPGHGPDVLVSVFDCSGRRVLARPFDIRNSDFALPLDVRTLSSGVYRVLLTDGRDRTSAVLIRP
jgi:photosystem II stability/assembly factor-like uncharacterized protein